jgi:hypothetical protein
MRSPRPHIAFVTKGRTRANRPEDDRYVWGVVDDLARAHCIDAAELDAVEAFLMPHISAILSGETKAVQKMAAATGSDSEPPQYPVLEKAERG